MIGPAEVEQVKILEWEEKKKKKIVGLAEWKAECENGLWQPPCCLRTIQESYVIEDNESYRFLLHKQL